MFPSNPIEKCYAYTITIGCGRDQGGRGCHVKHATVMKSSLASKRHHAVHDSMYKRGKTCTFTKILESFEKERMGRNNPRDVKIIALLLQ